MNFAQINNLLDKEHHSLSLWYSVFFIFGIVCYFNLENEPSFWVVISIFAISLISIYFRRHSLLLGFISSLIIFFQQVF
jgi:hypothetical protein